MEQKFAGLRHVRVPLENGGKVVVLDTGSLITSEAEAMLQALHSRLIAGIDVHLLKLAQKGAKEFIDTYYVGYGDKSIGDCGSATIFIEGVSMLVAKAVQDYMLYNGQESSTRYIDFSYQPFANPLELAEGAELLESLRAFHLEGLEIMNQTLAERHPLQDGEDKKVWRKAIKARAFDVMRSFLPAGATTNLTWHCELRQIADHLMRLRNHPLPEVRNVADATHAAFDEMFPSSFKQKRYGTSEQYTRDWMERLYYFDPDISDPAQRDALLAGVVLENDAIDYDLIGEYAYVLASRPIKTEPPKFMAECGSMRFSFLLDFGSFRDLQRHRALVQRMPLLTTKWGFGHWYLEQMPQGLCEKAKAFLSGYELKIQGLECPPYEAQYYVPMGYRVPCRITGDIPALIWFVELRSGISVHPTLRIIAQDSGYIMLDRLQSLGAKIYIDRTPDRFNYKRGTHDIVEVTPSA